MGLGRSAHLLEVVSSVSVRGFRTSCLRTVEPVRRLAVTLNLKVLTSPKAYASRTRLSRHIQARSLKLQTASPEPKILHALPGHLSFHGTPEQSTLPATTKAAAFGSLAPCGVGFV